VDSKLEHHTLSPAQLISELLTARVMHAMLEPRNAQSVTMVNSQIFHHAPIFATELSHMPNATQKPKNAKINATREIQTASTEISATSIANHQNQSAMPRPVNALNATKPKTQTAHN
jgi:hypothetical protein